MVSTRSKRARLSDSSDSSCYNRMKTPTEHKNALERQSESKLMTLPREIRNKIWEEVRINNIIHVSQSKNQPNQRKRGRRAPTFLFHVCTCPKGFGASAATKNADHESCNIDGPSRMSNLLGVCHAMTQENKCSVDEDFYSNNAFQFDDLITAESYLFGLTEQQRASITHIRLDIPFPRATVPDQGRRMHMGGYFNGYRDELARFPYLRAWKGICNYFSCPWDRNTLHMGPDDEYAMRSLREQVYFYYSDCYFAHNSHRLGHRWQVGLGGTSWDVGISDLKSKPEPRLDLAFSSTTPFSDTSMEADLRTWLNVISTIPLTEHQGNLPLWIRTLCQFRQYKGLNVEFHQQDEAGVKLGETVSTELTRELGEALKERLAGPEIGPQKCVFFLGHDR